MRERWQGDDSATIRAAADVLREGESDIQRRHATQRITRNAELMTRMIDELLDFTRIRLGAGIPIQRRTTDVAALAREVVSDLPPDVASRIDVDVHGNATGAYDTDRIWQAISSLVANALDHGSTSGRIRVIVDEIVAAHHGTIAATSDTGEVTFTINLPRRPSS